MDSYKDGLDRDPMEQVLKSHASLKSITYMKDILSSLSLVVYILNDKRQVVFVNELMLQNLGIQTDELLIGSRSGEVFNCVNSTRSVEGCGASEFCQYCGINATILRSIKYKRKEVSESVIVHRTDNYQEQIDLEITATPFDQEGKHYTIVSFVDISEKRRRQYMERIFYHDVINIAGSLNGMLSLLDDLEQEEKEQFLKIATSLSGQIIDEIKSQRDMQMAEEGDLIVQKQPVLLSKYLSPFAAQIQYHAVAIGKKIHFCPDDSDREIKTDKVLLTRVVVNMLKNALEASAKDGDVSYGWSFPNSETVRIWVQNKDMIPMHIQSQIFQRSFSTKGKGRGLGTYSMKLIGERYLNGHVGFSSNEESGTVFYIELPVFVDNK